MAKANQKKIRRHASVAAAVTVLLITAVILLNAIVGALATRYGWYVDMNPEPTYPATASFYEYVDTYVVQEAKANGQTVRILFCEDEDSLRASEYTALVLNTATELTEAYPDVFKIEYLNVVEQPKLARSYGVDDSNDVVVVCGDRSRVCSLSEFYLFAAGDTSKPVAYGAHRRLATVLRAVVSQRMPACYVTVNHGEAFEDYEILYAAADAGYDVRRLDTLYNGIPGDCELLITYNPDRDFTHEQVAGGTSEIEALRAYLQNGGRYMVFVSADTFSFGGFPNLEGCLSEWGVSFAHATGNQGGEECYLVRDPGHALSTDGYTLLARPADGDAAASVLEPALADGSVSVVMSNATAIRPAEGFVANGQGQYAKGDVTVTPLLSSYAGAEAWVTGRAVDRTADGYTFMTLSERTAGDTTGYVLACASTGFAGEKGMQTAVYDNKTVFMSVVQRMGKDDVPLHSQPQPMNDSTIRTMTTAQARIVTWVAVLTPIVVLSAVGVWVLLRRRYA